MADIASEESVTTHDVNGDNEEDSQDVPMPTESVVDTSTGISEQKTQPDTSDIASEESVTTHDVNGDNEEDSQDVPTPTESVVDISTGTSKPKTQPDTSDGDNHTSEVSESPVKQRDEDEDTVTSIETEVTPKPDDEHSSHVTEEHVDETQQESDCEKQAADCPGSNPDLDEIKEKGDELLPSVDAREEGDSVQQQNVSCDGDQDEATANSKDSEIVEGSTGEKNNSQKGMLYSQVFNSLHFHLSSMQISVQELLTNNKGFQ